MREDTIIVDAECPALHGSTPPDKSAFHAGYVGLLAFGHLVDEWYIAFLAPLLPLLIPKLGLSIGMVGLLATMQTVSNSLLQPIFGHLADRGAGRWFVPAGLGITAIFFSIIGMAPHYIILIIMVVLGGVGVAAFHPPCAALVGEAGGPRRGLGMSIFVAAGSIGGSIGPILIIAIVTITGLEGSYLIAVPGVVLSILLYLYAPHRLQGTGPAPTDELSGEKYRDLLGPVGLLVAVIIFQASTVLTFSTFVPTFLESKGYSLMISGASISIFLFCGAIGGLLAGYFAAFVRPAVIIRFCLVVSAPILFLFMRTEGVLALSLLGLAGLLLLAVNPLTIVMGQEIAPGRASMVSGLIIGFAWGVASLFLTGLGLAADRMGLPEAMTIMTVLPLLAALISLWLPGSRILGAVESPHAG